MKAVIFDLDGTILDSMSVWENICTDYLISQKVPPEKDLINKIKSMSFDECAEYCINQYGIKKSVTEIQDDWQKMIIHAYSHTITLKNGVDKYINKLYCSGIKMCIATAMMREMVIPALNRHNLLDKIEFIITDKDVGVGKSEPLIYEISLNKLGLDKSEVVIIEDALHAIQTAKKAGFTVWAIDEKASYHDKDKIVSLCDRYIYNYDQLL